MPFLTANPLDSRPSFRAGNVTIAQGDGVRLAGGLLPLTPGGISIDAHL